MDREDRGWGSSYGRRFPGPQCKWLSRYLKRVQTKLQFQSQYFLFLDSALLLKIKILPHKEPPSHKRASLSLSAQVLLIKHHRRWLQLQLPSRADR